MEDLAALERKFDLEQRSRFLNRFLALALCFFIIFLQNRLPFLQKPPQQRFLLCLRRSQPRFSFLSSTQFCPKTAPHLQDNCPREPLDTLKIIALAFFVGSFCRKWPKLGAISGHLSHSAHRVHDHSSSASSDPAPAAFPHQTKFLACPK